MELKDQVCSLEPSEKLKDLGVKQDGFYCYVYMEIHKETQLWSLDRFKDYNSRIKKGRHKAKFICSAFTVAELMWTLFNKVSKIKKQRCNFYVSFGKNSFNEYYSALSQYRKDDGTGCARRNIFSKKSMENSMAKMLIYLIKNKLIKV